MNTTTTRSPESGCGDLLPEADDQPPPSASVTTPSRPAGRHKSRRRSLRKNLRASVADGAAFSVMVGIGETYFPAFVLALGLGQLASGLVASLPILLGAILQLVSPYCVSKLGSSRRWVLACVLLQAASFIPLIGAAVVGEMSVIGVFAAVSLYWAAGLGAGPAWNTWMETVVPFRVRAPFFAMRTRLGQAGVLVGFLAGGAALQYGKRTDLLLPAFAAIFTVATACRFLSAKYLSRQTEPVPTHDGQRHVSLGELLNRIRQGKSERVLVYFLAVQVAVQISGPYFAPFMLGQMKISYLDYVGLLATSFVAKIIALPACGRFAARFGTRKLLWLGGIGIMPVAGLWLYAQSYWELTALQFLAGAVWAAYELAMFLMFFETVRREERTSIMTVFNLGNAVALVIGALIGGAVLKYLDTSRETYLFMFGLSSFARAATLICLKWAPAESSIATDEPEPLRLQPASVPRTVPATVAAPSK
jgi:MFS family permease